MQYIVLDLEWNQPINYQNRIYRLYGDRLVFEMIQIGAVRIDENLNILDSYLLYRDSSPDPVHDASVHRHAFRCAVL